MRNKRQLAAAFVVAAVLSAAMPLSADTGSIGGANKSSCSFILGLEQKGVPSFVTDFLWQKFGCDEPAISTAVVSQ